MRFARHLPSLLLLAPPALVVASFGCETILDRVRFDLRALKGSHSVTPPSSTEDPVVVRTPSAVGRSDREMNTDSVVDKAVNRTWTINPCGPIVNEKDSPSKEQCPEGTQGASLSLSGC